MAPGSGELGARKRVLFVEPHPHPGNAMKRYGDGLLSLLSDDFEVSRTTARHLDPRGPLGRLAALRRSPTPLADAPRDVDFVHMTDVYMSPHVRRFPGGRVVTLHDLMPREFRRLWPRRAAAFAMVWERSRRHLKHADLVLTPSEYTRQQLLALGSLAADRVVTVPPFFPAAMRPDATIKREPVILSVGPGAYYKNFPLMLLALAQPPLLKAQMVRVGTMSAEHRAFAAELGVTGRIEETGRVSDEELIRRYQSSAVLVQPSYSEGFGLPVAEAMLCGLPVVVSDGGSLPEVVGSAGRVVPIRARIPRRPPDLDDARAFAVAVAEVLEDASLQQSMSDSGLREARRFSEAAVKPQLLEAYAAAGRRAKARSGA